MAAIDTIKKLPAVGRQLLFFLRKPRQFVLAPDGFTRAEPTAKELFAWTIAFGTLVLGLYSLALGSPSKKVTEAALLVPPTTDAVVTSDRKEPVTFAGIAWMLGLGVGVQFPQQRPVTEPQFAVFEMGAVRVGLNNVIPQNVFEKGTPKFLLMLYAFVFVFCLHPVARLFRGRAAFRDALRLGFIFYGCVYLLFALFVVVATLLLVDLLRLRGFPLIIVWITLVMIPMFVVIIRCFFQSFAGLYGITRKRLILVGLGTWVSSAVVCPVVFLPLLFLLLRFESLWKLIL